MCIATILKRTAFFQWIISSLTVLVAVTGFASLAGATYALSSSRFVTWQGNVGVSGDIPARNST